jgi:hypothetical protein
MSKPVIPTIERKLGNVTVLVPDYSKPGVAEAVRREVEAEEFAATTPSGSNRLLYHMWRFNNGNSSRSQD